MKKITTKETKLLQYASSAIAFLMVHDASAAVVYTDVDPDIVIGGEGAEITLDVNEDGTDDFNFLVYNYYGTVSYYGIPFSFDVKIAAAGALNNNEWLGNTFETNGYNVVYIPILSAGEGINSEDSFTEGSATLGLLVNISVFGSPYYSYSRGNWLETGMEFLGFRLNIDTSSYYGWMRISVNDDATQLTIHDYAYESEADKSIFVGTTTTSISEGTLTGVEVYSYGQELVVNLHESGNDPFAIHVFDLSGKMVKQIDDVNTSNTFSCVELASGNYIVKVGNASGSYNKQVFIGN